MPAPIFGFDQIDPGSVQGGGAPARLGASGNTGAFWSDFYRQQTGASTPTPVFNTTNQDQARTQQMQVIQDLQRAAAGDPNSRAQQQLANSYAGAQSQQSSLGSTMRGQSAGAAQRGIQAGQQGLARQMPGDQQMLMAQEQQAAQQMLAQMYAQQQQQDISQAQGMANTALGGQSLNDQLAQFYAGMGSNYDIERAQIEADRNAARMGFDLQTQNLNRQVLGMDMQALGTGAAAASRMWGQSRQRSSQQIIDDAFNNG